jgi:hypothetical protein
VFLNTHWGRAYAFCAPQEPGGRWSATARSAQHERLEAASAAELLEAVREHYNGSRNGNGTGKES